MAVSRLVNESQRRVPQLLVVPGSHPDGAANAPKTWLAYPTTKFRRRERGRTSRSSAAPIV